MLSKKNQLNIAIFSIILTILIISAIGSVYANPTTGSGTPLDLTINQDGGPKLNQTDPNAGNHPATTDPTTPPVTTDPTPTTPTTTTTTTTTTTDSSSSSGGGGGGGGSLPSCSANDYNCTKWTDCKNSTQTRVCKLTKTNCQVQNQTKPEETLKCVTTSNTNLTKTNITEEIAPRTSNSITGAAIGAKIADNWVIIVSTVFIAIILLTYLFLYKIRR